MTDQTVPVPVDLLKELRDAYPMSSVLSPGGPISRLNALIPAPPKVGDVLTDLTQVADLPATTVLTDGDGDVYVVGNETATRVTDGLSRSVEIRSRSSLTSYSFSAYGPITVVYVPEDE